ncbi:MAG: tetratricopeptide repeat protein, partial [Thermoplasmata archaeon]|nr:tetratricopeptide repeat protein [Thermoplasmata archaeon]NIS13839.1 tetratricopeptide repeat protein [Thermoplasmata archaeon]NIS21685.1 tetratricopeptide repeat protein [Thermoplasmata archaeon]NIT79281.1 tetratricopeptide repeat protein [Thermoplasmata archaeon]NIU50717.1 tetratricopeptide repeat protein [Thermoplasmata archaeon]
MVPTEEETRDLDLAWLEDALEADPENFAVWTSKGALAESQGLEDEALEYYERALSINPDYREARVRRGSILLRRGETEEALEDIGLALDDRA